MMKKVLLSASIVAISTLASAASGGSAEGADWVDLALKTGNFLILFAIVYKFGKKPFLSFVSGSLEQRAQSYLEADRKEKEANQRIAEYEKHYEDLAKELERHKSESTKAMQAEKEKVLNEAKQIIRNLELQAAQTIKSRERRLREELALHFAKETIKEVVELIKANPDMLNSEQIIEKFLNKLEKKE